MATAVATTDRPYIDRLKRSSVLGCTLVALASLMIACGGDEGAMDDPTQSDTDYAHASECADARLGANMSAEEYRIARIEYRQVIPAYSSPSPAQLADAEFASYRTFIEMTPPGAQAEFAYEVCSDLVWLGVLEAPQLVTAALGFGYENCAATAPPLHNAAVLGNAKKLQDTNRRIYAKARSLLCPQVE